MLVTAEVRGLPPGSEGLVQGHWLPGELLGTWRPDWPAVLQPTLLTACTCPRQQCRGATLGGSSAVVVHDIDWAARTGRLEIGVGREADPVPILELGLRFGFHSLLLDRLWGWITDPGATASTLAAAGLRQEAVLPRASWSRDRYTDRELWAGRRDG